MEVFLVVGLGNPGRTYLKTRHNVGFMVADVLASQAGLGSFQSGFKCEYVKSQSEDSSVYIVKPQTFMNLSGEAVQYFIQFYKIPLKNVVVIQDDLDQAFGALKWQKKRGHGGHNGIRHIHQVLATDDYARLKIGVGKPPHPDWAIADWVLSPFDSEQEKELPKLIQVCVDSVNYWLRYGLDKTSTQFNKNWLETNK